METRKITILLAEDHAILREGLRLLLELEDDMQVTGEASNGLEVISLVKKTNPQVIVMDIAMPDLNGLDAARQVRKLNPHAKILILSAYADDGYVEKAASLGVSGFLVKQCASNLLVDAIRQVHKGNTYFSPFILNRMNNRSKRALTRNGYPRRFSTLSPREIEVLQLIAEGNANKQMADKLSISIKTVEKHRQHLMDKLQIHDIAGLTRFAMAEGLISKHAAIRATQ